MRYRNVRFHNQRITDALHPIAYRLIMGCAALWVFTTAIFLIGGHSYMGLILAVVTFFAIVAVTIPYRLWRVGQKHRASREREETQSPVSFRAWLRGEFETHQGLMKGRDAIVLILLPLVTVSIGGLFFAIIFHFTMP